MNDRLSQLVRRIFELNREYRDLQGAPDRQVLGQPATEQQIADVERRFSVRFPSDYRAFLEAHNGWRGFEGELDLLSTEQMNDKRLTENFDYVKQLAREAGDENVTTGFVIQGSATSADIVYLDFGATATRDSLDVVRWEHEEIERYDSFSAYLEDVVRTSELLVARERQRIR